MALGTHSNEPKSQLPLPYNFWIELPSEQRPEGGTEQAVQVTWEKKATKALEQSLSGKSKSVRSDSDEGVGEENDIREKGT